MRSARRSECSASKEHPHHKCTSSKASSGMELKDFVHREGIEEYITLLIYLPCFLMFFSANRGVWQSSRNSHFRSRLSSRVKNLLLCPDKLRESERRGGASSCPTWLADHWFKLSHYLGSIYILIPSLSLRIKLITVCLSAARIIFLFEICSPILLTCMKQSVNGNSSRPQKILLLEWGEDRFNE